ncbi:MAG: hypothetical protein ACI3W7_07125 [Oscillospiraceae bacterium]
MKKIIALLLAIAMIAAFAACGAKEEAAPAAPEAPAAEAPAAEAPAAAAEVTWADYQAYLVEKAGANAPDLDEFKAQVAAIGSWEELDQTVSPWDQMFTTIGLSTWDEFQAGVVKEPAVMGGPDASASGESSAEPAAEGEASGEPSGEPPVSAVAENTAHGGTPGAVSDADYQAYLKAWLASEAEVNTTMTPEQINDEFIPMIEAGNYTDFPVEMMFTGMLNTGAAMTFDEFVAANGVY